MVLFKLASLSRLLLLADVFAHHFELHY
jgi:hypothetical protein